MEAARTAAEGGSTTMNQLRHTARIALAAATALTAFAAPAAAQQIDRIVAFGDSYADTGNFFRFVGVNPASTVVYSTGRFSGGTNYIDTLSQILGVPVDNFAIGGALTTQFNTNTGPSLGFPTEYGSFLTGGAGATPFPAVSGTFGEGDLLAISIGGNDARIYQTGSVPLGIPVGTLAGAPAAGAASAAAATAGLNLLVAAGAPTISYLAGNTANIPEVQAQANPAAAFAVRDAFFQSFDAAMRTTLAGYAANGEIVHYLDLNLVGTDIQSNFAAYGLTALVCPAFPNPTCAVNSTGYLFYGDQLHLTPQGFAIVAQYIAAQLDAPLTLQAPSDSAMDVGHQFGRTLTDRLDLSAPRDGDMPEGMHAYIVGDAYSRSVNASQGNHAFDSDSVGVTAGVDYGFGSGVVGIAANYSKPNNKFDSGAADVKSDSIQLGAYAGVGFGGAFAQGYAGYGWDNHDIRRRGVVEGMSASPNGNHWIAGGKVGYLMNMGGLRLGPIAALDYAHVKVDSYTEDGDPALTLNVGGAQYSSLRGSLGAELRGDFAGGGIQLRPYASLVAEKELDHGNRSISFAQTSAPTIVNHFDFDDASTKIYGRGTVGATARLATNISLDAGVSMTAGKKQGNETSGHLGLRVGF
jgi:outer membrane lipase/esterase